MNEQQKVVVIGLVIGAVIMTAICIFSYIDVWYLCELPTLTTEQNIRIFSFENYWFYSVGIAVALWIMAVFFGTADI